MRWIWLIILCCISLRGEAEVLQKVTVRSQGEDAVQLILDFELPASAAAHLKKNSTLTLHPVEGGSDLPCQAVPEDGKMHIVAVLPELKKGEARSFHLNQNNKALTRPRITVHPQDKEAVIEIDGKLLTRYGAKHAPNKPVFYPLFAANGESLVRHWPVEQRPGETNDHPHHRGLWFTHGDVNGVDFWTEGKGTGNTVLTGLSDFYSGPVAGGFQSKTDWKKPDGTVIARDVRKVQVYLLPNGDRAFDFTVEMTPVGGALTFGDTKEGTFGFRLAMSLTPDRKLGAKMVNSEGKEGSALWGKKADWVDYSGTLGGTPCGIAMLDAPENLRHPETWHSREYGLFAVNPFGLHDFGQGEKGAGNLVVASSDRLKLRYRLIFHAGGPAEAKITEQYAGFEHPPLIECAE